MPNLEDLITEMEEEQEKKINRTRVKDAAMEAAKDIFGDEGVDESKVDSIVNDVLKHQDAEDTESAIQIAINMLRSE